MKNATKLHARLGFPLYDVGQLILYRNKENANIPHSPEGTNLTLAERIKKEFAILNVFFGGCWICPHDRGCTCT